MIKQVDLSVVAICLLAMGIVIDIGSDGAFIVVVAKNALLVLSGVVAFASLRERGQ